jgi:hypothetical protein
VRCHAVAWLSDEPFPGLVQVELQDGEGRSWVFADKAAMFDERGILRRDSIYPIQLDIACTVLKRLHLASGEKLLISTASPWGVATENGTFEFLMKPDQVHLSDTPANES